MKRFNQYLAAYAGAHIYTSYLLCVQNLSVDQLPTFYYDLRHRHGKAGEKKV